jgi:hypothetical protein
MTDEETHRANADIVVAQLGPLSGLPTFGFIVAAAHPGQRRLRLLAPHGD